MTATIITKNSSTASAVPTAGQLQTAEIVLNTTDRKLFTKDATNTVVQLVGTLGNQDANIVNITGGTVTGLTNLVASGGTLTNPTINTPTITGGTVSGAAVTGGTVTSSAISGLGGASSTRIPVLWLTSVPSTTRKTGAPLSPMTGVEYVARRRGRAGDWMPRGP